MSDTVKRWCDLTISPTMMVHAERSIERPTQIEIHHSAGVITATLTDEQAAMLGRVMLEPLSRPEGTE